MWEIDVSFQALGLVMSVVLGVVSAVIYDFLRAFNSIAHPKAAVMFFLDILYWGKLTILFFCFFMVFSNGQPRLYVFMGALGGFILSRLTVSKIFFYLFLKILSALGFFAVKIKGFLSLVGTAVAKILKKLKKSIKKAFLKTKKA